MKACAVVSEFNPFHNGHKYLLDSLRAKGFDTIVCVMSANFVQRGEHAVCDKKIRAKFAVESGADLVLSLPFPWSSATAEIFAGAAVSIMNSVTGISGIGFGCECDDMGVLFECADFLRSLDRKTITDVQKENPKLSFVQARSLLAERHFGEKTAGLFGMPNNILALEYLKALKNFSSDITPCPVKREEASHDGSTFSKDMCSSSRIRKFTEDGDFSAIAPFVPWNTEEYAECFRKTDKEAYFSFLRGAILSRQPEELSMFAETGGGFEYAIYREILVSKDYDTLFDALRSRHLTDAKIRRALLFASLGVKKEILIEMPKYTEVLAANEKGREFLKSIRKTSKITILSKTANIKNASEEVKKQFKVQRTSEIAFETLLK